MGRAEAETFVNASLAEVWALYFEAGRWPAWVDGFRAVDSAEGYPGQGGTLVWHSVPNGRGAVREKVLEHTPRRLHRIRYEDPESQGELLVRFQIEGEGTRVSQELSYSLRNAGPLGGLIDRLFVRSQMRNSMVRSLGRMRTEAEEDPGRGGPPSGG